MASLSTMLPICLVPRTRHLCLAQSYSVTQTTANRSAKSQQQILKSYAHLATSSVQASLSYWHLTCRMVLTRLRLLDLS